MSASTKGFTLIELLVVIAIIGIFSSVGVVAFNSYISNSKNTAAKKNYELINKVSESEFAKCKLNKKSTIFNNHSCASSSAPTVSQLDDYFTNTQKLKNPYNQSQKVIQSDICTSGSVVIKATEVGTYETSYFSQINNTKNASIIKSTWAQKYSDTASTSISFTCTQTASAQVTTPVGSFDTYKAPVSGGGAGIIVDKNGNMVAGTGAMACGADCFTSAFSGWLKGSGYDPAQYKIVMAEAPSSSGNIASACAGANCKYNFSDNTFTVINTGKTYTAGVSIDIIYK